MDSDLRGSMILHRYDQAHRYREGNADGVPLSPTRKTTYHSRTKSAASSMDRSILPQQAERIVDDLTLGYHVSPRQRYATERNPKEYEPSPASSRSFRIVSLDGCYEEQVSPLLTDSSSSISSNKIRKNVPKIPAPPRCVMTKRQSNVKKLKRKTAQNAIETSSKDDVDSGQREEVARVTRPSANTIRRRRSCHARSQFVFDGNLCFGAVSPPPPMYLATSPVLAYSPPAYSPPRASFPGAMGMSYQAIATPLSMSPSTTPMMPIPITPMTPMSPPQTPVFNSVCNHREQEEKQQKLKQLQKQGRKTPPPTPEEQRRRNRAMPSGQYEDLVFNQLRREEIQKHDKEQLQRQNTW